MISPLIPKVRMEVDHHASTLYAGLSHILNAERNRVGGGLVSPGPGTPASLASVGPMMCSPARVAVVINGLGDPVAIGIKSRAHMRQAIPLGRILEVHHHQIVADDVGLLIIVAKQSVAHIGDDHRAVWDE